MAATNLLGRAWFFFWVPQPRALRFEGASLRFWIQLQLAAIIGLQTVMS
jgi:hypothetical protein